MARLEDKVALITGSARGQGAAAARKYVAEGARVVLADVLDDPGEALAEELGEAARFVHVDVGDQQDWQAAVRDAVEWFGTVDVLINNAGVLHFSALDDTALADYERLVRINQVGAFLGMREVAPVMSKAGSGSIVNVSSIEGLAAMPHVVAYTATKFAVRGMTKVAALELGERGIRVNSVHPGMIDTDMLREVSGYGTDLSPVAKKLALRRLGRPEEVADLMVFLGSSESSYCTGGEFAADGGATAAHSLQT